MEHRKRKGDISLLGYGGGAHSTFLSLLEVSEGFFYNWILLLCRLGRGFGLGYQGPDSVSFVSSLLKFLSSRDVPAFAEQKDPHSDGSQEKNYPDCGPHCYSHDVLALLRCSLGR